MVADQDTEITLGTGKLLGIFFLLVVMCAAFFTLGYLFGRGSTATAASTTVISTVPGTGGSTANKPSAGGSKSVETTQSAAQDSSVGNSSVSQNAPTQAPSLVPAKVTEDNGSTPPAEVKTVSTGSYMVQVAAVSKQEDAEILVNALRKKQYPVLMVANVPGDSLFHVQVGPFSDPKEAEAMRSRLAGDGYNAIVKK